MYRERLSATKPKSGLDTNFNSAPASLKFTRPDIWPTFVYDCQFECFLFGAKAENKKCIENGFQRRNPQSGLDTNLSSAAASLKFTRPDIWLTFVYDCQFE
jgi:hypothetical protein